MKSTLIIFFLLSVQTIFAQTDDSIRIQLNFGIDSLNVYNSTKKELLQYRGLKFEKRQCKFRFCGRSGVIRYTSYTNDSLKLNFDFYNIGRIWPLTIISKKHFSTIEISSPLTTVNGLVVGQATKSDVIATLGLSDSELEGTFYYYFDYGMTLYFNEENVLETISLVNYKYH